MANAFIAIDPADKALLLKILRTAPKEVRDAAVGAVAEYELNVMREYPPVKHVTRQEAFGRTFQSDKQRRYFFGVLLKNGQVPYRRTQTLRTGWRIIGSGQKAIVANETSYGPLVMGQGEQSRMMIIIGWKTPEQRTQERMARIDRIAEAATEKGLRKAGAK